MFLLYHSSTALFVSTVSHVFPQLSVTWVSVFLTVFTLFFGELIPNIVGSRRSIAIARLMMPMLMRLTRVMRPLTSLVLRGSDSFLKQVGVLPAGDNDRSTLGGGGSKQRKEPSDTHVSEDMLRMVGL